MHDAYNDKEYPRCQVSRKLMDNELVSMLGMRERNARILDWDRLHISDLFLVCALAHVCVCMFIRVVFPGKVSLGDETVMSV